MQDTTRKNKKKKKILRKNKGQNLNKKSKQENTANTYRRQTEHWTAVSILLGLISSAHRDLYPSRSNQQPQYAEAETLPLGHRFMPHISDET